MGQGYSLTTLSAGSASIDIPELADLTHEKSLGTARFMKSIRAHHRQGLVFVKAIVKPYSSMVLAPYVKSIELEKQALAEIPNALGYQRVFETSNGGYMLRQFVHSSVYDRLSTRPFLEDIEKKWLAFQLLSALRDCHSKEIFHGDIKTENLLVTSWNWLYLTDFSSSFKPTYLPEDNPADFSFYFDTSGRRTCYLAPERFLAAGEEAPSQGVTWAMDIFSAGCAIAEIFLEGPIFNLSQLFKYRSGDYSPEHAQLDKIEDVDIRELISHMIQLDPESRYSADEYLNFWRRKAFPEYFYTFLHQYMGLITDPSSGRTPVNMDNGNSGESDEKIDRIYYDFDKISYFLGFGKVNNGLRDNLGKSHSDVTSLPIPAIPQEQRKQSHGQRSIEDGSLIFLAAVASSLRNTAKASARVRACDLLIAFAERLPDEAKLDRVLPYLVTLLNDRSDSVKIAALKSLTRLLSSIRVVSPVNASIFQDYIFPRLRNFVLGPESHPNALVRSTYASCMASLAQSSANILDMVQAVRADGHLSAFGDDDWTGDNSYHTLFDFAHAELVAHFEEHTKSLLTDPDASVRRAFLGSVSALCVFFGSTKANDVILSHLNTYLNEKDWILKCAFFEALVGVAAFVGTVSLETFILPLMVQSLTDPEEFVIECVLRSLASMAELGLFQNSTSWDLLFIVVRLMVHPNSWIREAAVSFVVSAAVYSSPADRYCIIFPLLQTFLKLPIQEISQPQILESLKKPLQKPVFDMAMTWAAKTEKGAFWKSAAKDGSLLLNPELSSRSNVAERRFILRIPASSRNDEDEQWLAKLQGLGMQQEDEFKLMALRAFIWRVNQRTPKGVSATSHTAQLGSIVKLSELNIKPTTIMFDETPVPVSSPQRDITDTERERPHTLADALLDASTTIDNGTTRVKHRHTFRRPQRDGASPTSPQVLLPNLDGQNVSQLPSSLSSTASDAYTPHSDVKSAATAGNFESSSPSEPERGKLRRRSDQLALRHHSSAVNLMKRNEYAKADAATSTTSTNAFGKLDATNARPWQGPSPLSLAAGRPRSKSPLSLETFKSPPRYKASHTYTGNDPTVLRLLNNVFMENFPVDILDFGPPVLPVDPRQSIKRASDPANASLNQVHHSEPWHPSGRLVVLFSEHTAPVTSISIAPDHAFFLTASDDSTVKLWDAIRLEKNVTPRSRYTYKHAPGSKVKSLCFVEETHTFVSGSDDGCIHVVKIDHQSTGGESLRYGKPQVMQEFPISAIHSEDFIDMPPSEESAPAIEYATHLEHIRTESSMSTVFILTSRSRLIALDLKTMRTHYTLQNPARLGIPISFCLDRKNNWILIGTSHGILSLWDLRFRILLRTWGISGGTPIQKIALHPNKGRGRWVVIAGGASAGEITVWDIEKVVCREVYRTSPPGYRPGSKDMKLAPAKAYEPWFPDEVAPEVMLTRFATKASKPDGQLDPLEAPFSGQTSPYPSSTTSLFVGTDTVYAPSSSDSPGSKVSDGAGAVSGTKTTYFLSGGSDCKTRYWDVTNPSASSVMSGQDVMTDERDKPRYDISHFGGSMLVVTEWIPSTSVSPAGATSPAKGKARPDEADGAARRERERERNKLPRNELIPLQQQRLLRSHMDGITDCAVLKRPYGMVVSTDRLGCVYVFQ